MTASDPALNVFAVETVSIRNCERDGCANPVTGKATARFCSPTCRREHNRLIGDGQVNRKWVPGRWVTAKPQVSRKPRVRRPRIWETVSPVTAFLDLSARQRRAKEVPTCR